MLNATRSAQDINDATDRTRSAAILGATSHVTSFDHVPASMHLEGETARPTGRRVREDIYTTHGAESLPTH